MENIFLPETTATLIERINKLTPETRPLWGKMKAPQMLAHLNVAYEMAFEDKHKKPNAFMRLIETLCERHGLWGQTLQKELANGTRISNYH